MNTEDRVKDLLCGAMPRETQTAFGVQHLGLAAAGMPVILWAAVRYRYMGDQTATRVLCPALTAVALCSAQPVARRRAGDLAVLALADDARPGILAKLGLQYLVLGLDEAVYFRYVARTYEALRARLDDWTRQGIGYLANRTRGGVPDWSSMRS